MYIYVFTNKVNGKCYVGQTIQEPNIRKLEHLSAARTMKKKNHKFYNALRKYGMDGFDFTVEAIGLSINHLNILEEWFVNYYNSIENGYNLRQAGNNKLHSKESIEKMRIAQKEAHAKRRSEGRDTFVKTIKTSGWKHSEESREKRKEWSLISNAHCRGKTWTLVDGKRVWMDKV